MEYYFLPLMENTGEYNMAKDLELAASLKKDTAILRFYRWNPYCISLGANQLYDDINSEKCKIDNIGIVKRPTGGRAILHAEELTYSFVIKSSEAVSPRGVYEYINAALKTGLEIFNPQLSKIELEGLQTDFKQLYKDNKSILCFASTAKSELKYNGKKVVGSAQRKLGDTILQHGSILCGTYHKKIVDYITNEKDKAHFINEIENKTIEIDSILNSKTDYEKLSYCLLKGFEEYLDCKFLYYE